MDSRKRRYGTGHVYKKHGAYYGRWRTSTGRLLNRRIGVVRTSGSRTGLTQAQAERRFGQMQEEEERRPTAVPEETMVTVVRPASRCGGSSVSRARASPIWSAAVRCRRSRSIRGWAPSRFEG